MGYIVQSIVFDKDKGWDIKTARKWIEDHKEFSKPIKVDETTNTFRFRLFPPKKAEQMGFKDYRMKTLASGDVGIMLDIAYNKMKGGADNIEYEDEDPIEELRRFNSRLNNVISRIKGNTNYMRQVLSNPNANLTDEQRTQISNEMRLQEQRIATLKTQIKKNNDDIQYHRVGKGGSLANEDLQALLAKSYNSKDPSDYKDFQVDKELSGQRVQVYHNPTTQQTVVAHRGTASVPNWIENVAYAVSNNKSGKAFQHSKKIQDQAYAKYGKENITTIGHSKGALHAQEYGKEGKEVITLNKPVNITDALFTRVPKSQTDIRTQYDPVSFLRPFQRGSKVETIKSTTKNPLKEHKTSVLERLDPRRLFGSAIEDNKENLDPNIPMEQHIIDNRREEQRRVVTDALNDEIANIVSLYTRERNDPRSLRTGLVPPYDIDEQMRVIRDSQLAPILRDRFVEAISGQQPVIYPDYIRSRYRTRFIEFLTRYLDRERQRRSGRGFGSGMMCSRCGINCCCGMMRGGVIQNVDFNGFNVPLDMSSGNNFVNSFLSWYLSSDEDRGDRYMDVMNRDDIIIQTDNADFTLPEFLNEIQGQGFQELIDEFEEGNNNVPSVREIMGSGDQNEIRTLIMRMMDIVDGTIQEGEERIQDIEDDLLTDPNMNVVSDDDEMDEGAGRKKRKPRKPRKKGKN